MNTRTMLRAGGIMCLALSGVVACGPAEEGDDVLDEGYVPCEAKDGDDLFATSEACSEDPKADTGYVSNLNAREMEVTIEGDVSAPSYDMERAPLASGQFALTFFRQKKDLYIQSLAEDYANGGSQTEWKVGTAWKKWSAMSSTERSAAKHFRLVKINAVLMNATKYAPANGKAFTATVPLKPTTLYSDVQRKCEGGDGHIQASSDVYWYVWDPAKSGCTATKTEVTATITNLLPKGGTVYPEYDKLYADKQLDVIVFFGKVDDGAIDTDSAYESITELEHMLTPAGFKKVTAPKGLRYERTKKGIKAVVDVYGPREFEGLQDTANLPNFLEAVKTHELVIYNGHSVLGASDFWANQGIYTNPTKYQIFLYNGCLGYEYYVLPILKGKKSEANVDIISNVLETPAAVVTDMTSISIAQLVANADTLRGPSWQTILGKMNAKAKYYSDWAGEAFFGVSGARTNTFKPR